MTRRLLLSYLALISLTVALLVTLVRVYTSQTFSRYISEQSSTHSRMLPVMLAGYFSEQHSWEGVQQNIEEASSLIGAPVVLADADGHIVAAMPSSMIGEPVIHKEALGQAIPIMERGGAVVGTVYVSGRSLAQQRADQEFLNSITSALVGTGLFVALLAMGVGVVLARSINRPLAEMVQAAVRIAEGNYDVRVVPRGGAEVTALAQSFNSMAEGVGSVDRLRRELVANVSHDLRTPLTVIRGYLDGLRSNQIADRHSAEKAFDAIHMEVTRLLRMVDNLRQVAQQDAGRRMLEHQVIPLDRLARTAITRVEPLALAKGVILVNHITSPAPAVHVDPEQIGQVLFNLLQNAIDYTPKAGTVTLRAGLTDGQAWLEVKDTGIGIPPQHLPHIFERFYRADRARSQIGESGMGLGLAIVRSIVEAHNGRIEVSSDGRPGLGTTFTVYLSLANL